MAVSDTSIIGKGRKKVSWIFAKKQEFLLHGTAIAGYAIAILSLLPPS